MLISLLDSYKRQNHAGLLLMSLWIVYHTEAGPPIVWTLCRRYITYKLSPRVSSSIALANIEACLKPRKKSKEIQKRSTAKWGYSPLKHGTRIIAVPEDNSHHSVHPGRWILQLLEGKVRIKAAIPMVAPSKERSTRAKHHST